MNINAFKVVDKRTRHGTNWSLYNGHLQDELESGAARTELTREHLKELEEFEEEYKEFFPIYEVGATVQMAPKSVGLMAFETYDLATEFINSFQTHTPAFMIIDVEVIDEPLPRKFILSGCGRELQRLRKALLGTLERTPAPRGTIFCKNLKVLN